MNFKNTIEEFNAQGKDLTGNTDYTDSVLEGNRMIMLDDGNIIREVTSHNICQICDRIESLTRQGKSAAIDVIAHDIEVAYDYASIAGIREVDPSDSDENERAVSHRELLKDLEEHPAKVVRIIETLAMDFNDSYRLMFTEISEALYHYLYLDRISENDTVVLSTDKDGKIVTLNKEDAVCILGTRSLMSVLRNYIDTMRVDAAIRAKRQRNYDGIEFTAENIKSAPLTAYAKWAVEDYICGDIPEAESLKALGGVVFDDINIEENGETLTYYFSIGKSLMYKLGLFGLTDNDSFGSLSLEIHDGEYDVSFAPTLINEEDTEFQQWIHHGTYGLVPYPFECHDWTDIDIPDDEIIDLIKTAERYLKKIGATVKMIDGKYQILPA